MLERIRKEFASIASVLVTVFVDADWTKGVRGRTDRPSPRSLIPTPNLSVRRTKGGQEEGKEGSEEGFEEKGWKEEEEVIERGRISS
ncbi:MAG TPA: hypothetical protein VHV77_15795 [Pirellulales bacterium]|nr:hypothetical protein [Pirellulales bacterium]